MFSGGSLHVVPATQGLVTVAYIQIVNAYVVCTGKNKSKVRAAFSASIIEVMLNFRVNNGDAGSHVFICSLTFASIFRAINLPTTCK